MAEGGDNSAIGSNRRRRLKSPFFTFLGIVLLALAVAGFWPQYFSAVLGRSPEPNTQFWLIHMHAALFIVWLLFYVSQSALIMMGRTRTHTRLGPPLVAYGFVVFLIGLYASVALAQRLGVRESNFEVAAAFVFFPLIDMLFFVGFLAIAVAYRRVPSLHKRAMFLATFSMAIVGLGRLVARLPFDSALIWQPINLAPLLIAIGYDLYVHRKLHPILVVGLLVHLARLNAEPFANSEFWLPVGRLIVASS